MLISSVRIAASSSVKTADAPCIDVPPVILTFVLLLFGTGEDVRDVLREDGLLFDLKSEINEPAAEGGGFGAGAWTASSLGLSVKALLRRGGGRLVM